MDDAIEMPVEAQDGEETPIDIEDLSPEQLFERNLEKFKQIAPGLHKTLANHKPISKLVFLENGEPTVSIQGENVHPEGAVTHAREQLDAYNSHVVRLKINEVGMGLDHHSKVAYKRFEKRIGEAGISFARDPVKETAYMLFVFGIGLAQHLDELVDKSGCRVLVLVEPNIELLYHSCSVYDWATLTERMKSRGGVEFLLDTDVANSTESLLAMFRQHNPTMLDGAIVFRHARTPFFNEIERGFYNRIGTAVMGLGFFQDEINMIGQTYKNLERQDARLIRRLEKSPGIPCFIVGNGPSLETLMPFMKKHEDNAVIFACGSSLHTLLENDIKPDFWVISERMYFIYKMAEEADQKWGVSDIRFIGSTTIFPGTPDFFKEPIYFFRPGLSPAPLFSTRKDQIVSIPDPLAANAGLAVAVHLGFREFYFCGVDGGSKFSDRGHAKGGYYAGKHDHLTNLKDVVPGNFGGKVYTTAELTWSRDSMEKLIARSRGRVFYNLCDGALIDGATPQHHKAAKLSQPTKTKRELLETLVDNCPEFSRHDFEDKWERAAIIDRLPEYCQRIKDAVLKDDMLDYRYGREISLLLEPLHSRDPMAMLLRGTIFGYFASFEWLNNRIVDETEREVLIGVFQDEFETLMDDLQTRAMEIFMGLEDGEAWEQFEE